MAMLNNQMVYTVDNIYNRGDSRTGRSCNRTSFSLLGYAKKVGWL
jgi:hypothetical protein